MYTAPHTKAYTTTATVYKKTQELKLDLFVGVITTVKSRLL